MCFRVLVEIYSKRTKVYELVKKKNLGTRIIIGIAILLLINTVVKMIFRQPQLTLNEELVKSANEINKNAPFIIDSTTRLDNVIALPGYILRYNFTITNFEKSELDTTLLKQSAKESMLAKIKTEPKAEFFRKNNVELQAHYQDKLGTFICLVSVTPYEYKRQ